MAASEGGEVVEEAREDTPLLLGTPYTVFSQRQKLFIVLAATFASTFSPLSANIYYPALNAIGEELDISDSLLNLTITSYMVCLCNLLPRPSNIPIQSVISSIFRRLISDRIAVIPRLGAHISRFIL